MNSGESGSHSPQSYRQRARQIVERLIYRGDTERGDDRAAADAVAAACDILHQQLSRWVGLDGGHALFARALAESRSEYPLLEEIELQPRSVPYVNGVREASHTYGASQTSDAIEAMLVRVIELLGRLIGDDMAAKLVEQCLADSASDVAPSPSKRAEA